MPENMSTFIESMYQEIHCENVEIDSYVAIFKTYLFRKKIKTLMIKCLTRQDLTQKFVI